MTGRTKQILLIITYTVLLLALMLNLQVFLPLVQNLSAMLFPVFVGLMMAFVLNVPMRAIESKLKQLTGKSGGPIRGISLLLTLLIIILVIVLAFTLVIPEVIKSVHSVDQMLRERLPQVLAWLESNEINIEGLNEQLAGLNLEELATKLLSGAGSLVDSAVTVVTSTVNVLSSGLIALVIAVYVLTGKEALSRQARKLLYAMLKADHADHLCSIGTLINETYTKFLGGQCVEACILGVLMFLVFTVVRLPYAGLVAVLAAICSFIPYVGAFIACAVGAVLTLMTSPFQAVVCVGVYLAVQFVENQFIYPRVVGSSVGLSPLLTLLAVLAGGQLMGVVGMVFFIPLVSVIYTLLVGFVNGRLKDREISVQ